MLMSRDARYDKIRREARMRVLCRAPIRYARRARSSASAAGGSATDATRHR